MWSYVDDQVMKPPHLFCNVCKLSCKCGNCKSHDNPFEVSLANKCECLEDDVQIYRSVDNDALFKLEMALYDLKNDLEREIYISTPVYETPDLLHGLDRSTIKVLTHNAGFIFSVDEASQYISPIAVLSQYLVNYLVTWMLILRYMKTVYMNKLRLTRDILMYVFA